MLLKLRGMCAVLLAALAFAGCSDDDAASSLATNFDELEFSYEESDQQLLIRSTVGGSRSTRRAAPATRASFRSA